jgi:hypothetical protein
MKGSKLEEGAVQLEVHAERSRSMRILPAASVQ